MHLHTSARSLCTIHLALDEATRESLGARHYSGTAPTHALVGIALHRRHHIDARLLRLQHTCHVVTLAAYHIDEPEVVHIHAERYASRVVATQMAWRSGIPSTVISRSPMTLALDEDDTSQTIALHHSHIEPLRMTATFPRYERAELHEPLLHASTREYVGEESVRRFAQRSDLFSSWTVQSHRASHFAMASWAELLGDFHATVHVVHMHHAPHLHLLSES